MMAQISSTTTIQQQARDQLHDLKLSQKAMATREEIVEDIAGQCTSITQIVRRAQGGNTIACSWQT